MASDALVDVSYRGLVLGKGLKLTEIGPRSAYVAFDAPMPVGAELVLAVAADVRIAARVARVTERGTDERPAGMWVQAAAAEERAQAWWEAHATSAADPVIPEPASGLRPAEPEPAQVEAAAAAEEAEEAAAASEEAAEAAAASEEAAEAEEAEEAATASEEAAPLAGGEGEETPAGEASEGDEMHADEAAEGDEMHVGDVSESDEAESSAASDDGEEAGEDIDEQPRPRRQTSVMSAVEIAQIVDIARAEQPGDDIARAEQPGDDIARAEQPGDDDSPARARGKKRRRRNKRR